MNLQPMQFSDEPHRAEGVGYGMLKKGTKRTCNVRGEPIVQMKAPEGGAWKHVKK